MITQSEGGFGLEVDGPDPVPWPGENYELLKDIKDFIAPSDALATLAALESGNSNWKLDEPQRANVEEVYTLKRDASPLEIRVRVAGLGAHNDTDYLQYVLECKHLLGTQVSGRYSKAEVARGTLEQVGNIALKLAPEIEAGLKVRCRIKEDHPIVANIGVLQRLFERARC